MKRSASVKSDYYFEGAQVRMHIRNDLHLVRKAWHLFMGLMIVAIYMSGMERNVALYTLSFFLGLVLSIEALRLNNSVFNEKFVRYWAPFMRSHELNRMSTVAHYISSVMLAIAIFPRPVAILSILYLACGDPIASLCGILYGHRGPRLAEGKTLVGTVAGSLVCTAITVAYLMSYSYPKEPIWAVSLVGGLAGGLAELVPFRIDDNFTIPVISGFVLWLAFMLAGFSG